MSLDAGTAEPLPGLASPEGSAGTRFVDPEPPAITRSQRRWLDDERLARLAWSRLADPGDQIAGTLRDEMGVVGSLAVVLGLQRVSREVMESSPFGGRVLLNSLEQWRVRLPVCDPTRDQDTILLAGGAVLVPGDEGWPPRVAELGAGQPPCLWVRGAGSLLSLTLESAAVVGSRACSRYGEMVTAELVEGLSEASVTVVSGAAFGIDAAAHRAAIMSRVPTVAVLACGADRVYPSSHGPLLARIAEDGVIVSECPPGAVPSRWRFLERNRLIAALTRGTVVVEAAWRSGALSTARHACELGRPLGAVPGPVTSAASAGCHRLLRDDGATVITNTAELLELIRPVGTVFPATDRGHTRVQDGMDQHQQKVWEALPVTGWRTEPQLSVASGLPQKPLRAVLRSLIDQGRVVPYIGSAPSRWKRADQSRREVHPG